MYTCRYKIIAINIHLITENGGRFTGNTNQSRVIQTRTTESYTRVDLGLGQSDIIQQVEVFIPNSLTKYVSAVPPVIISRIQ